MKREWIDVSAPLQPGVVRWPGDPPFELRRVSSIEQGDDATVSAFTMCAHTGTHIDAPLHFLKTDVGLDRMPIDAVIGDARVIEINDPESIKLAALRGYRIRRGERVLFKTRNSQRRWHAEEFSGDFVFISPEAARYLAEREVRCVGVDCLSVGAYAAAGKETHEALLGAGIWIIEGLDLSGVAPGRYDLICLPLRILDSDGAPARAVLRPRRVAA
jgi:arylformamidase